MSYVHDDDVFLAIFFKLLIINAMHSLIYLLIRNTITTVPYVQFVLIESKAITHRNR